MSHLVLKTKELHSKTENGKKKKKNGFDTHDVDVHSMHQRTSAMERPSFSLLEPSDFFHFLQLNICWLHFRSSLGLFSLNHLHHCNLDLRRSWRPQRIGGFNIDEFAPENAEHLQPLINDLLTVSRVTGNRIM